MNSHLTYLLAQEKATDLARHAAEARLAKDAQRTNEAASRDGLRGRVLARLRLRVAGGPSDGQVEPQRPSAAGQEL